MRFGLLPVMGLIAAATAVLLLFTRASMKGDRRFSEGRVLGITGKKGHGKTIFGVHELLRHVGRRYYCRKCSDATGVKTFHTGHIASNGSLFLSAELRPLFHRVSSWADLADGAEGLLPHGTLIMVDEAHLAGWAPAQAGQVLPPDVQHLLSQCRKYCYEIMWISQDLGNVSSGLRRQTDEIARCQRSYFRQMRISFFEIVGGVPQFAAKPSWRYGYRVTKRLGRSYNTYELLELAPQARVTGPRLVRGPSPVVWPDDLVS